MNGQAAENLLERFSYLKSSNADYIEELYRQYVENPDSVDDSWRFFFEGMELGNAAVESTGPVATNGHAVTAPVQQTGATVTPIVDWVAELKVTELIEAYRTYGKYLANVDPLHAPPSSSQFLDLATFGLSQADLSKKFQSGKRIGLTHPSLQEILDFLRQTYCSTIATEITHMPNSPERQWVQQAMESARGKFTPDAETRKHILKRLSDSETFEKFLHTRYVAQKRFSVEGGEGVIPCLDAIVERSSELGVKEVVLGMAHRGRLNVLVNIFGKHLDQVFVEFEGTYTIDPTTDGEGDVKYHKGYSRDVTTRNGKPMHLSLAFNPSHLEFVNPVIEGMARAKQDARYHDPERTQVIPVQIHGDAAFAGQGICYETINFSQLDGYKTGGTIHIIINNQVGFTTSPIDSRSTPYCSDLAKFLDAPVFHVNGDDADAVWFVSKLCTEYRQKFKKDIFIDLICYRKHGHNEGDEPSFTQPILYKEIKAHATPREVYSQTLQKSGVVTAEQSQAIVDEINAMMIAEQKKAKAHNPKPKISTFEGDWKGMRFAQGDDVFKTAHTAVDAGKLLEIATQINATPAGFKIHPKLERFFEARMKAVQDGKGLDWGNGEALAFATLVNEGHMVRLSGQDVERGTFTHRHSILNDFETGQKYSPLDQVKTGDGRYDVHNSSLSESGIMGFEFGYSIGAPNALVIWEAQFGDFANGAQVIIDQFISTSESKWRRASGLVLLLPHGQEGQGPEHSSARLERFLSLCGKNNMIVANFTTPAQLFHALRRQVKRDFRKPMVVMSPKSLLRHPMAISSLDEFSKGQFHEVLDDPEMTTKAASIKRVLLCTGKVYYELLKERHARSIQDIAIVRVEQLYPWPEQKLAEILGKYSAANDLVWVQEEPRNMGAWTHVFGYWSGGFDEFNKKVDGRPIRYVGRDIAASPAVGSPKLHESEQKSLVDRALSS